MVSLSRENGYAPILILALVAALGLAWNLSQRTRRGV